MIVRSTIPCSRVSAVVTEPTTPHRPLGQSGYGGVVMNGSQVASPTVASLPSVSPFWIAVTGRHHMYWSLAFQTVPAVSAMLVSTAANSRALSEMSSPRSVASFRRAACIGTMPASEKKSAVLLCSAVRTALLDFPRDLTSLYSSR